MRFPDQLDAQDPDAITPAHPMPQTIQAGGEQQEQKFGDRAPPHEPTDPQQVSQLAGNASPKIKRSKSRELLNMLKGRCRGGSLSGEKKE